MRLMFRTHTLLPLLAAAFSILPLKAAYAALSGTAEVEYIKYDAERNGSRELEATSFRHNYSVNYNTVGSFIGGRLGGYKGMIGYEWGAFDTELVTPGETFNPSMSSGNLLYSGEFLLDPRELPLRLSMHSRDTLRNSFVKDTVSAANASGGLINPGVMTDINNTGTNIESGATLRFGVKNGMTNGYNAIFRHVPLLLLDYKDVVRKNMNGQSRIDTRLKRLAFVSLNKKDNWFHYRLTRYTDNLSPLMSYSLTQVQLGTVDEKLERRWIEFTNWIKVSTDVQFTKRVEQSKLPAESYDVNLFVTATRKNWELRNFNSFTRSFDHNTQKVYLDRNVPIFLNGVWGRATDWSVRLSTQDTTERPPDAAVTESRDLIASYRINTFNRSNFTLGHTASVEHYTNLGVKTLVLSGNLQTASTRKFSDSYRMAAAYSVMRFDTENNGGAQTNLSHDITGNVSYLSPSRRISLNLIEQFKMADGVSTTNGQTTLFASSSFTESSASTKRAQTASTGYKRMSSTFKADWTPEERVQVGGYVAQEMFMEDEREAEQSWTMQAYARYNKERLSANLTATYIDRSGPANTASRDFRGTVNAGYYMNKDVTFGLRASYINTSTSGSSVTNMDMAQSLSYRYMTLSGGPRRLLEASEEFSYTRNAAASGSPLSRKRLTLGLSYYPWANLFVSNRLSYAWGDADSQTDLLYNGSIGISYAKLQASLDYSYGTREAKNDNRKESRLAANMKKFF
ncbi:MAG: hypothetical protein HYS23_06205 [Geobacter sp.]|nr:hypothetical protein [Geobacter sp.]